MDKLFEGDEFALFRADMDQLLVDSVDSSVFFPDDDSDGADHEGVGEGFDAGGYCSGKQGFFYVRSNVRSKK